MWDPTYPANMPDVWTTHWARIPEDTGHAVVVGEWGGLWRDTLWDGHIRVGTEVWQRAMLSFLVTQKIGFFCA